MPYVSTAQQRWAHTPAGTRALGGAAKVHEWDEATKNEGGGFAALPKHTKHRAHASMRGLASLGESKREN